MKKGKMSKARKVFDEMPEKTTTSYIAMITPWIMEQFMPERSPVKNVVA